MSGKTGCFIRTLSAVMAAVLLIQFAFPALAESLPETVQTTKAPAAYTTSRIVIELDQTDRMSAQEAETAIGSIVGSAAFSAREELIPGRYICVDIGDCAKMPETLMRLNASDAVAGASADGVMHTCAGNGDPDAALPSELITPANALVDQPAGITVGLLDTGVNAGDSALTGRLDQENARSFTADGDTAHGTNAARILALANGVTILPLTVVDGNTGTCQLSAVIQAIGYAMEKGVGLLNCSFCFDEYNTPLKDLMEDSGILFVAAVGNGGDGKKSYPAAYGLRNVIAVGSVDADNRTADNVSGNNVTVYTTPRAESDAEIGGNSFAAATVTATVALMRQAAPILDDAMIQQALAKADPTADGVKTLDPSACVTYVLPYACLQDSNIQKLAALDGKGLNAATAAVLQRHPTAEGLTDAEWTTLREHFELSADTVRILRKTAADNADAALPLIPLLYAGLTADRQGVTVRCFLPALLTQTADAIGSIEETGSWLDALDVSPADAAVMAELTESGHTLSALLGAYLVTRIAGGELRAAVRAVNETTDAYSDDVRAAVEAYSVSGSYIGSWFARESTGFSALRAAVARYTAQRGVTYADGALTLSNAAADRMELYARYPFANAGSWPVGEFSVNKLTGEAGYSQTLTSFLNALPELTLTYDPQAADILSDVGPAAVPSAVTYYVSDGRQPYRAIDAGELPYYLTADCRLTAAEAVGEPVANFYERLYGIGAGWRLNIPAIETDGLILHGSDGSKTEMTDNGDGTYTLYGRLPDTYSLTAVSPMGADGAAFCYTDLSRDRYFFDASGRFLKKENEYGRALTASYDSQGRLSALTEGNRSLQFVRTVSGNTEDVALTLVSGTQSSCLAHMRKTKDDTTDAYLLTSVSDAVGDTTSFGYDKQTCAVLTNYCSAVTEAEAHTAVTAYLTQVTTSLGAVHTLSCEKAVKAYGAAGERDYYRAESVYVNGELLSSFGYRMGYSPFFPEVSRFTPTDTLCFSRVNNNRLDARTWTLSDGRCAYAGVNVMESEEYREYICFDGFTGRELGTAVYHEDTPAEMTEAEAWDCRGNVIRTRSYHYVSGTQAAAQQVESARYDRYGNPLFRSVDLLYTASSGVSVRLPQSYTRYTYDYSRSLTTPIKTLIYTGTDEKQNTLLSSTVNQIERVTIGGRTVEQVAKTEKYKQDRINGVPQCVLQSASAYTYDGLGRMTAENKTALKNEKIYAEALTAGTAPDAAESYTQSHTTYVYDDYDDPVKTTVTGIHAADGSVYRLVTEQEYDFRGLLTLTKPAYRTDDAGNVLDSYAGSISGTAYTYNGRGECIRTEKPDGTVEETVIENRLPDGEKDIAGSPYAGILNRVTTRSSGEPDAITLKDSRGRSVATKKKMADGTEITLTESEYDAHDRLLTQTEYTKNDCTEYTVTTYAYDWQGREISSVSESFGEDGQQTVTGTQTTYGTAVVAKNVYETVTVTDVLSGVSTTSYTDGAERTVLTVTATDGRTVNEFGVFGAYGEALRQCGDIAMSTESKADADGKETTQVFGTGDNATVQESQHDGNGAVVAGGTKKSKSYSVYDELGQEIRVETDFAQDADGNPVRSVTEYTYDGLGRRIRQRTLADGDGDSAVWAVTEYGYDALGRLIWVDEQESADIHHVTRYAYDAAGRKIA